MVLLLAASASAQIIVSAAWLKQHLTEVNVAAVASPVFESTHIPGAVLLPPKSSPMFSRLLSVLASDSPAPIVLYQENGWPIPVSQAFLELTAAGLGPRLRVLDGGLRAWRSSGGPTESGPSLARAQGGAQVLSPVAVLIERDAVLAALHRPGIVVLDDRLPAFFGGELAAPGERHGHVPGAINLPFTDLANADGTFASPQKLAAAFEQIGATSARLIVIYCHSGRKAALAYVAGRQLDLPMLVYPGSWHDWSASGMPSELNFVPHPR